MKTKRKTIASTVICVTPEVKKTLTTLGKMGESYDDVLRRLLSMPPCAIRRGGFGVKVLNEAKQHDPAGAVFGPISSEIVAPAEKPVAEKRSHDQHCQSITGDTPLGPLSCNCGAQKPSNHYCDMCKGSRTRGGLPCPACCGVRKDEDPHPAATAAFSDLTDVLSVPAHCNVTYCRHLELRACICLCGSCADAKKAGY